MEPAYLYGFEKYSKEFNILNENPVICKRIEDIILKTKKDYHNHIVEKVKNYNADGFNGNDQSMIIKVDLIEYLQDTNPKEL